MELRTFETHGRKLLVEFKCRRCQITVTRPLKECMNEVSESYYDLYDLKPPKEWKDGGFYYPTFCSKCAKAYEDFMKGGTD